MHAESIARDIMIVYRHTALKSDHETARRVAEKIYAMLVSNRKHADVCSAVTAIIGNSPHIPAPHLQ